MNKKRSSHSRQPKRGFSFIEVLVVIIILGLLSGIVGVYLFDSAEQAKADATKTQIKGLETALDLYRLHNSRYPSSEQGLKALLSKPEVGVIPDSWNGPYLRGKNLPKEPKTVRTTKSSRWAPMEWKAEPTSTRISVPATSEILKSRKGFSFLELMVVIALAALLAGYAVPNFTALFTSPQEKEYQHLTKVLRMLRTDALLRSQA